MVLCCFLPQTCLTVRVNRGEGSRTVESKACKKHGKELLLSHGSAALPEQYVDTTANRAPPCAHASHEQTGNCCGAWSGVAESFTSPARR
eukprot:6479140-Amphidinium_carterae.1